MLLLQFPYPLSLGIPVAPGPRPSFRRHIKSLMVRTSFAASCPPERFAGQPASSPDRSVRVRVQKRLSVLVCIVLALVFGLAWHGSSEAVMSVSIDLPGLTTLSQDRQGQQNLRVRQEGPVSKDGQGGPEQGVELFDQHNIAATPPALLLAQVQTRQSRNRRSRVSQRRDVAAGDTVSMSRKRRSERRVSRSVRDRQTHPRKRPSLATRGQGAHGSKVTPAILRMADDDESAP